MSKLTNLKLDDTKMEAKCTYPIDLIELLEGYSNKVYKCSAGKNTIGLGFNMDASSSKVLWHKLHIPENFSTIYAGVEEISRESAEKLALWQWKLGEKQAKERANYLHTDWNSFREMKKAILTDIAYNTGYIGGWTKVFKCDGRECLLEARRRQRELDSRVAKIGHYFGEIDSVDDAIALGLTETKYIV